MTAASLLLPLDGNVAGVGETYPPAAVVNASVRTVNLDLRSFGVSYLRMDPDQARALAAMLIFFADEVEA